MHASHCPSTFLRYLTSTTTTTTWHGHHIPSISSLSHVRAWHVSADYDINARDIFTHDLSWRLFFPDHHRYTNLILSSTTVLDHLYDLGVRFSVIFLSAAHACRFSLASEQAFRLYILPTSLITIISNPSVKHQDLILHCSRTLVVSVLGGNESRNQGACPGQFSHRYVHRVSSYSADHSVYTGCLIPSTSS